MLALPEGYSPLRLAMAAMKSDDLASGTAVRPEPAPPKAVTIAEIVPNTGVENIAMHMKQKADDMELQIRCASALGHIAYKANHKRHKRGSGQMKTIHFDFDEVPLANIQLQQAGAVSLGALAKYRVQPLQVHRTRHHSSSPLPVIQAVLRYTNNRRCALRCMWALEHLCAVPDAYTTFEAEGGKSLLQTLEAMYRRDPDMMASVTHLKKPPSTGQTSDCSIQ